MPTFNRASFATLLLALRQQIADAVPLALPFVVVTLDDDCPHFRGDRDVLLTPGGESPDEPTIDGGGRLVNLRHREVFVRCRLRRQLDRADADLIKLTDESLGFIAFEDAVVNACECWLATNAGQDALALPADVGRISEPKRDREDANWVSSRFTLTMSYVRDLDQSVVG